MQECPCGTYQRSEKLPLDADPDNIVSCYCNGILKGVMKFPILFYYTVISLHPSLFSQQSSSIINSSHPSSILLFHSLFHSDRPQDDGQIDQTQTHHHLGHWLQILFFRRQVSWGLMEVNGIGWNR